MRRTIESGVTSAEYCATGWGLVSRLRHFDSSLQCSKKSLATSKTQKPKMTCGGSGSLMTMTKYTRPRSEDSFVKQYWEETRNLIYRVEKLLADWGEGI